MAANQEVNPKDFGDQFSRMVKAIKVPDSNTYDAVLASWRQLDALHFDTTNGELAWLRGTVANKWYHIDPKKRGKRSLTKKDWADLRKLPEMARWSDETIRNWKKIADKFSRTQSRSLGLSKMYDEIRGEAAAKRALSGDTGNLPPGRTPDDTQDKSENIKPAPIAKFPACWDIINEQIGAMAMVANAPDRFVDPKGKIDVLEAQDANIKTMRGMLQELEKAIASTMKELQSRIDNPPKGIVQKRKDQRAKAQQAERKSAEPVLA